MRKGILRRYSLVLPFAVLLTCRPAAAQLMLPGAVEAQPPAREGIAPNAVQKTPKPLRVPPPSDAAIVGRELLRDGADGAMIFQAGPGGLEIAKLALPGEAVLHPGGKCQVDLAKDGPIQIKYAGRPKGVSRYEVTIEACPFSLEVLEGAVLVTRPAKACDVAASECRPDPAGLWGPRGDGIGPDQVKQLELDRGRAESAMRANFRALLAAAGKDKEAIKRIAGEQAGFSSEREMICRSYLREDVHGFCALRLTQARALGLQAAFDEVVKRPGNEAPPRQAAVKRKPAGNPNFDVKTDTMPEKAKPSSPPEDVLE